jgi:hypothetical protein
MRKLTRLKDERFSGASRATEDQRRTEQKGPLDLPEPLHDKQQLVTQKCGHGPQHKTVASIELAEFRSIRRRLPLSTHASKSIR